MVFPLFSVFFFIQVHEPQGRRSWVLLSKMHLGPLFPISLLPISHKLFSILFPFIDGSHSHLKAFAKPPTKASSLYQTQIFSSQTTSPTFTPTQLTTSSSFLPAEPITIPIINSQPHNFLITKKQETGCRDLFPDPRSSWGWIVLHFRKQHQHFFARRSSSGFFLNKVLGIVDGLSHTTTHIFDSLLTHICLKVATLRGGGVDWLGSDVVRKEAVFCEILIWSLSQYRMGLFGS